ncbi:hypothetical protein BDR26DRAFT_859592 [Obelidium mucronatum]|nr:hypothetical protein BDR26DRAFT_859592 [Obelidium mucronatum]
MDEIVLRFKLEQIKRDQEDAYGQVALVRLFTELIQTESDWNFSGDRSLFVAELFAVIDSRFLKEYPMKLLDDLALSVLEVSASSGQTSLSTASFLFDVSVKLIDLMKQFGLCSAKTRLVLLDSVTIPMVSTLDHAKLLCALHAISSFLEDFRTRCEISDDSSAVVCFAQKLADSHVFCRMERLREIAMDGMKTEIIFTVCDAFVKETMLALGLFNDDSVPLDYFFAMAGASGYNCFALLTKLSHIDSHSDPYDSESSRLWLALIFMLAVTKEPSASIICSKAWREHLRCIILNHPLFLTDFAFMLKAVYLLLLSMDTAPESFLIQSKILKALELYVSALKTGSEYFSSAWEHDEVILIWLWELEKTSWSWKSVTKNLTVTWMNRVFGNSDGFAASRVLQTVLMNNLATPIFMTLLDEFSAITASIDCVMLHTRFMFALENFDFGLVAEIASSTQVTLLEKLLNLFTRCISVTNGEHCDVLGRIIVKLASVCKFDGFIQASCISSVMDYILSTFDSQYQLSEWDDTKRLASVNVLSMALGFDGIRQQTLTNTIFLELFYKFITSQVIKISHELRLAGTLFLCGVIESVNSPRQPFVACTMLSEMLEPATLWSILNSDGRCIDGDVSIEHIHVLSRIVNCISAQACREPRNVNEWNRTVLESWYVLSNVVWDLLKIGAENGVAEEVLNCMSGLAAAVMKNSPVLGMHMIRSPRNSQLVACLVGYLNADSLGAAVVCFYSQFPINDIASIKRVLDTEKVVHAIEGVLGWQMSNYHPLASQTKELIMQVIICYSCVFTGAH